MNDFDILKHAYDEKCLEVKALRRGVAMLEEAILTHKTLRLPHMTNEDDRMLWALVDSGEEEA